ncbi:MFS transporter [Nakamurella multipartita]|uniref:Major facilitator superfamily MFS_1 n=1 Tax=Nakamurella multipartita (strain ATCC 700099 / DSM 44233 / CIP 104796 / JCM 9543 / NBRC 105858 / Y-104) TaxID=479431 RepID=C8X8C6_NAKMY|nr:MFS transporter [Nakamurella multipartita]ACV77102.1 major facilitator superfamily MFS_1 [Nakamurella multipartita DSM 44233]
MPSGEGAEVTLRDIAPAAFLPPAVFAVGQGAIAPVIVISATDLGASPAMAALVVALAGLGQVCADIPAGSLVHRFGERPTMIGAALLTVLALVGCMVAGQLILFAAAIFVTGACTAVWLLARQAFVTEVVPYRLRARAMSTLGGVFRIGLFIGPFVGSAAVHAVGLWGAYAVHVVAALVAAGTLLVVGDPKVDPAGPGGTAQPRARFPAVLSEQRSVFATLGVGVLLVSAIRAVRQVALPLWGQELGLSPAAISLIFGVSGAIDMLLFYPAGKVMDRFGRMWVAVPAMTVLGLSLIVLPLTDTATGLMVVGLIMGIGNGMSAGLVMTLGADLAPPGQRPVFLGIWRVFSDSGNGAGPFVIAGVTALASLGAGIVAMGIVGLLGGGWLGYWIPRRVPPPTPRDKVVADGGPR